MYINPGLEYILDSSETLKVQLNNFVAMKLLLLLLLSAQLKSLNHAKLARLLRHVAFLFVAACGVNS